MSVYSPDFLTSSLKKIMKISLEFESIKELKEFIQEFGESKFVGFKQTTIQESEVKIPSAYSMSSDYAARKRSGAWSELDIQFLKDNYLTHKLNWIGKKIGRSTSATQMMLHHLYKLGIPKKTKRSSEVVELMN